MVRFRFLGSARKTAVGMLFSGPSLGTEEMLGWWINGSGKQDGNSIGDGKGAEGHKTCFVHSQLY